MVRFVQKKIDEEKMKEEENQFEENLGEKRENLYIEDTKKEDNFIELSFWMSVIGGVFLAISLFGWAYFRSCII